MSFLSDRVRAVAPSMTLVITAKAQELKRLGEDVIGLSAGEPDFDTPEHIRLAAIAAIEAGHTRYTAVDGIPELKKAVVEKFKRENQLDFSLNEVMISNGGKQTLFNAFMALLNPGDEVIVPAPYWVSYPDMAKLMGAEPVFIEAGMDQDYKITAEQLAAAITPKTKIFIINSPSNPSGAIYSAQELRDLAEVLRQHPHIVTITDDMYEHILLQPGMSYTTLLQVAPDLKPRVLVSNGVSKAYAMTGWRIGYIAGPAEMIKAMSTIQGQSTSNPASVSQYAALAALTGPQNVLQVMLTAFRERHEYVVRTVNTIPGMSCKPAQGAFYTFINVKNAIQLSGCANDLEFASWLLDEAKVAVVPGSGFGLEGYMRISFATSLEQLTDAFTRIKRLMDSKVSP